MSKELLKNIDDAHKHVVELRDLMNKTAESRNRLIASAVESGVSQSDIARMLDVSRHRVSQLAAKGRA